MPNKGYMADCTIFPFLMAKLTCIIIIKLIEIAKKVTSHIKVLHCIVKCCKFSQEYKENMFKELP